MLCDLLAPDFGARVLNRPEEIPRVLLLNECTSCGATLQHFEVPLGHRAARCFRQVRSIFEAASLDATGALRGVISGHERFRVLQFAKACYWNSMGAHLFWVLLMHRTLLGEPKLGDSHHAMLTCLPTACSEAVLSQWLAPTFIHSGTLEGIVRLQKSYLDYSCQGASHVSLHPRHAFPASSDRNFRKEVAASGKLPPWPMWFLQPEPIGAKIFGPSVLFATLPQPQPKPLRPSSEGQGGVAVLFAGSWRYEERTLASLARHLVRPLSATVLCALSGGGGSGWRERQRMKKFFPALAGFRWLRDLRDAELRKAIAPKALLLYETFGGGAISPLRRNKLGGQLHSLRKMQIVWQMTKSYERKRRRRFRWVIYSRLDLIWVANHPPLHLLEPPNTIWTVPLAAAQGHKEGFFAMNDWHGTVPRQWAEAYFGRWWMLRKGVIWQPYLEPEELLASVCFWLEIPVGFFDAVFSLSGCRKWSCQFEFREQP